MFRRKPSPHLAAPVTDCPNCRTPLHLTADLRGRHIRCGGCPAVLHVEAADRGGHLRAVLAAAILPCPRCGSHLHLYPELNGRQLRCRSCAGLVEIIASPWRVIPLADEPVRAATTNASHVAATATPTAEPEQPRPAKTALRPRKNTEDAQLEAMAAESIANEDEQSESKAPAGELPSRPKPNGTAMQKNEHGSPRPAASVSPITVSRGNGRLNGARKKDNASSAAAVAIAAVLDSDFDLEEGWESAEEITVAVAPPPEPVRPVQHSASKWRPIQSTQSTGLLARKTEETAMPATRAPAATSDPAKAARTGTAGRTGRVAAKCAVLGLVAMIAYSLLTRRPVPAEARYLPEGFTTFVSMDWNALSQNGVTETPRPLPGLGLAKRCQTFLMNAGISPGQVERINAGGNEAGTIVVYRLKSGIDAEKVMQQPAFSAWRKGKEKREEIRGVPVFLLDGSVVAFPDERTIVVGEAQQVREALAARATWPVESLRRRILVMDFSRPLCLAAKGIPPALTGSLLHGRSDLLDRVETTEDDYEYGATIRLRRTFHCKNGEDASLLEECLQTLLAEATGAAQQPEPVRAVWSAVQVSSDASGVAVQLSLPQSCWTEKTQEVLKQLF